MEPILFLDNAPKVTPHSKISYLCETYGIKRVENDSAWYEKTRGGKPASIFSFWGYKLAEFAASQFLTEHYQLPQTIPDTNIYKRGNKTWDADLIYKNVTFCGTFYDELRFHVKSANAETISEGYPESFMFNIGNRFGKGGIDKIINDGNEKDIIIMVYNPHTKVEMDTTFYIRGMVPWNYAKKHLENPIAPSLIGKKICLYTNTLKKALLI